MDIFAHLTNHKQRIGLIEPFINERWYLGVLELFATEGDKCKIHVLEILNACFRQLDESTVESMLGCSQNVQSLYILGS